jgi:hypothetical protein
MKLRFLPAAREELEAAALYLDERSPGLGADLIGDVEPLTIGSSANAAARFWSAGWLLSACIVAGTILFSGRAEAGLKGCGGSADSGEYKIYVDDVQTIANTAADAGLSKKVTGLRDFAVGDLRVLMAGKALVRPCQGRIPRDAGDFDDLEMELLDNGRVLLEVWASVEDPAVKRSVLGFVLVPTSAMASKAVYTMPRAGADFLAEARLGTELRVFAPLALGLRAYKNQRYEDSIGPLCQGIHQLGVVLGGAARPEEAALRADEQVLLGAVRKIAADAIAKAHANPQSPYSLWTPGSDGAFACPAG